MEGPPLAGDEARLERRVIASLARLFTTDGALPLLRVLRDRRKGFRLL